MVWRIGTGWRVSVLFLVALWILGAGVLLHPPEGLAQRAERVAAASPGGALAAESLNRIVEGAKREGVVDAALQASLTPRGVAAVQEAIRKKYGFDLRINYSPTTNYPAIQAKALTEHSAGTPPSFDLITGADSHIFDLSEAKAVERVEWGPLLDPGTPPEIVVFGGTGLVVNTSFTGLLYNPKVVRPEEVPRSLKDLANPKWRGKILIPPYTSTWMSQFLSQGRQPSVALVNAILNNGAVVDQWPTATNRFTMGEYPLVALITETFAHQVKSRGLPVGFRPLDAPYMSQHIIAVRTHARHPNAAKLLAAFLAGPDSVKIWQEIASNPNFYYPAKSSFDLGPEWQKIRPWLWTQERLRYKSTPEVQAWEEEIGRLLTRK